MTIRDRFPSPERAVRITTHRIPGVSLGISKSPRWTESTANTSLK